MTRIKNKLIVCSLLLVVLACQFAHGESDISFSYLGNMKDLFFKEEQAVSPTPAASPKSGPWLELSEDHSSFFKVSYMAIPEFDNNSLELMNRSYKSDKLPFLSVGTSLYEQIGGLAVRDHPEIYSFLPLTVYVDLYKVRYDHKHNIYLFSKYSNWGRYVSWNSISSNYDSIKTSYLNYGLGFVSGVGSFETGVLRIDNDRLKDHFYYISVGIDIAMFWILESGI